MATRVHPLYEAARLTTWQLLEIGREIRIARISSGKTQVAVARAVHTSGARISRIERGLVPSVTVRELSRIAAAVGLKLYLKAYPGMRRLLDKPQLQLFSRLRSRAHPSWRWETEVPVPIPGDLRAGDARSKIPGCAVLWELWTRLADWQGQTRAAQLKARDLSVDRLVIVLRATRANRQAYRAAGTDALASFPLNSREILRALKDGRDPGANGILLL